MADQIVSWGGFNSKGTSGMGVTGSLNVLGNSNITQADGDGYLKIGNNGGGTIIENYNRTDLTLKANAILTSRGTGVTFRSTKGEPNGAILGVIGSGTTSSTTALLVQNANASGSLQVYDSGQVYFPFGDISYGSPSGAPIKLNITQPTGTSTYAGVNIGHLNSAVASSVTVVGGRNTFNNNGHFIFGHQNNISSASAAFVFGSSHTQTTYGGYHIMIGYGHTSDAYTNGQNASILIGQSNNTNGFYGGGLIGSNLKYYANRQLAFGGNSDNVNFALSEIYFGNGVRNENTSVNSNNGHGPDISINTSQAYSGSLALNRNGGSLSLRGGQGTGTGSAGDVIFATATTGSDGATYHSYSNRVWVKGHTGFVGIGTSSPSASLHVTGSTLITGSLTFNGSDLSTAWTSYTPTWTSDGTAPSLGDGTLTGAYKVVGKTCFVRVRLIWGTTTTSGTGVFYFDLPVSASTSWGIQMPVSMLDNGNAWYQATANGEYGGFTNKVALIGQSAGGANSSQGVAYNFPFTFANLDSIQFNGSYEIA